MPREIIEDICCDVSITRTELHVTLSRPYYPLFASKDSKSPF